MTHICPECGARKPDGLALTVHRRVIHPAEAATRKRAMDEAAATLVISASSFETPPLTHFDEPRRPFWRNLPKYNRRPKRK